MLDMGFEPQIMKIILDIRPDRQTVMTRSEAHLFCFSLPSYSLDISIFNLVQYLFTLFKNMPKCLILNNYLSALNLILFNLVPLGQRV